MIPLYSLCHVHQGDNSGIAVTTLGAYIKSHSRLVFPHRHSFYQILYVTGSGGEHIIDFETYPVREGMAFFLSPGQIHEWKFTTETEGFLINMGSSFFSTFLADSTYLDSLVFFSSNGKYSALDLSGKGPEYPKLFRRLFAEGNERHANREDMLRALLLELFALSSREVEIRADLQKDPHCYHQFRAFEKLVEKYYTQKKLPKEYAEMLFITPNYLNALCIRQTGRRAGDLIRSRILLESKRLLAHSDLSVSEIGWELNFESNSYFSRFFKRYEGVTPEEFRKKRI
ncbi:MAG: hypothetical protein ABS46_01860 [Cytophagaceae bacterium SCN 52-12]|nr:MAG: hypothetical protein ABS46_01860 [Cytophagaceae bacterium SCN 52-12]